MFATHNSVFPTNIAREFKISFPIIFFPFLWDKNYLFSVSLTVQYHEQIPHPVTSNHLPLFFPSLFVYLTIILTILLSMYKRNASSGVLTVNVFGILLTGKFKFFAFGLFSFIETQTTLFHGYFQHRFHHYHHSPYLMCYGSFKYQLTGGVKVSVPNQRVGG